MATRTLVAKFDADTRGFDKGVATVERGSGRLGSVVGGGMKAVGKASVAAVGAVTAVGAAVGGLAIKGGIDRALNIEDAEAKLKGLGHSTKAVDKIMDNALASVEDTAFGLDEAATTAANAVAAGIKPGQELTGVLKTVASTATVAGTGMDEMGSIFNKVAASNKLSMAEVNQLSDRGVPVLKHLADQMGTTQEAARQMVSSGQVDFATFEKAMSAGMGDAALEAGKTVRAQFANMQSAMSKWGASLVEDLLPLAGSVFTELKGVFKALAGDGDIDAALDGVMKSVTAFVDQAGVVLSSLIDTAVKVLPKLLETLGQVVAMLITTIGNKAPELAEAAILMFAGLIDAFATIVPALITAAANLISELVAKLGTMMPTLIGAALTLFLGIADALMVAIPQILDALATAIPLILTALTEALPRVIAAGIELFTGLVDAVLVALPLVLSALIEALPAIVTAITEALPLLIEGGVTLFLGLVDAILIALPQLIQVFGEVFPQFVDAIIAAIPLLLEGAIQLMLAIVDALPVILPILIQVLVTDVIPALIKAIIAAVPMLFSAAIKLFGGLLGALGQIGSQVVGKLGEVLGRVWGNVKSSASSAWEFTKKAAVEPFKQGFHGLSAVAGVFGIDMSKVWNSVKNVASKAWQWIKNNAIEPYKRGFANLGEKAGTFRDVVSRVWNAVKNAASKAWTGIRDRAITPLKNGFQSVLEKARNIKDGIVKVFSGMKNAVSKSFSGLKSAITKPVNTVLGWIDKHLVGNLNKVTSKFGLKIPSIGGGTKKARGGIVPGHGHQDSFHAILMPGEGILTKRATRAIGGAGAIEAINRAHSLGAPMRRTRRRDGIGGLGDFAGDVASGFKKGITGARDFTKAVGGKVGGWLKKGAGFALGKILGPVPGLLRKVAPGPPLINTVVPNIMEKLRDKAKAWGKEQDTAASSNGYSGPINIAASGWTRPVSGYRISAGYLGYPGHYGIDLAVPTGTPVHAASNGVVTSARALNYSYGHHIRMAHHGATTLYAHMSRLLAHAGQVVKAGQVIGLSGSTGNSTGPHLHFETGGGNPSTFMAARGVRLDSGGWLPTGTNLITNNTGAPERVLGPQETKATLTPNIEVKVYVGDKQITDIVRTEVTQRDRDGMRRLAQNGVRI